MRLFSAARRGTPGATGLLLGPLISFLAGLILAAPSAAGTPVPGGDYRARIRANDAPLGGRFTIEAWFLDSLDVAVPLPGPGRVLALGFRDANGKDSFLIPGDLAVTGDQTRWDLGFLPLGEGPFEGLLARESSRWALWWVPWGSDSLTWESPLDLHLEYGFLSGSFSPLGPEEAEAVTAALPWALVAQATIDPARPASRPVRQPDPASFDDPPIVLTRVNPIYPRSARLYDLQGTVHVAARVGPEGRVTDAYVIGSTAGHQLNVSALVAVMDWKFRPGKKNGIWTAGEMIIPIQFSMGGTR